MDDKEYGAWLQGLWKNTGLALNADAAIYKYWLTMALSGNLLGPPVSEEYETENGDYIVQSFTRGDLYYDKLLRQPKVYQGLPLTRPLAPGAGG